MWGVQQVVFWKPVGKNIHFQPLSDNMVGIMIWYRKLDRQPAVRVSCLLFQYLCLRDSYHVLLAKRSYHISYLACEEHAARRLSNTCFPLVKCRGRGGGGEDFSQFKHFLDVSQSCNNPVTRSLPITSYDSIAHAKVLAKPKAILRRYAGCKSLLQAGLARARTVRSDCLFLPPSHPSSYLLSFHYPTPTSLFHVFLFSNFRPFHLPPPPPRWWKTVSLVGVVRVLDSSNEWNHETWQGDLDL